MRPTVSWIKTKIDEWNRRCFGGLLPPLPVQVTQARSYCGQLVFKRRRVLGKESYSDFRLRISAVFDYDEESVVDTIIHELIHYEILYNGLKDSSSHGTLFRRRMNEINQRFGRNVTISEKLTKERQSTDQRHFNHLVCLTKFGDGRYGVTRVARTCIFQIWNDIHTLPNLKDFIWVWTTDPFFNRFPRSQKVIAYKVDSTELIPHLDYARMLQRTGNTIHLGDYFDAQSWFDITMGV